MQLVRLSSALLLLVSLLPASVYGRESGKHIGAKPLTFPPNFSTPTTTTTTSSTPATTTTTSSTPTTTTTTVTPPLDGLPLYEETRNELQQVSDILDKFTNLVYSKTDAAPVATSAESVQGGRSHGHPGTWWLVRAAAHPRESTFNFCDKLIAILCRRLETQLERTDNLLNDLRVSVDDWQNSELMELRQEREGLNETYKQAEEHQDAFIKSVDEEIFTKAIDYVKQNVISAGEAVQKKIDLLDPTSNPGSVVLVAVLGSVGVLMVMTIIGVMVYATVKKPTAKKLSSAPSGKVTGENIPIYAFVQDGPRSHPASRMDPHSQAPVPAPTSHHYVRRESVHPEFMDGRHQKGLLRTNF